MPLSEVPGKLNAASFCHATGMALNTGVCVVPHVMVKLLFEISKKVCAPDITITRAVLVETLGQTMVSVPSFAVVEVSTYG